MSEFSFLGFEFSSVGCEDQAPLSTFLRKYPQPLSGYTYSTMEAWKASISCVRNLHEAETLLIAYKLDSAVSPNLLQPVGLFTPEFQERLLVEAAQIGYPLKIVGVSRRFLEQYPEFVSRFSVREERNYANYVYRSTDLAQLKGRKYSKKRNLIAQAQGRYSCIPHTLTQERIQDCFSILDAIREEENPVIEGMRQRELAALETTLRNFQRLEQQGLIITADGQPAAFSIFEAINPTTITIHFERALRRYKGMYQVINHETAKVVAEQGFEFINREEDVGDPGLRSAKMSYHPVELVPAYELVLLTK